MRRKLDNNHAAVLLLTLIFLVFLTTLVSVFIGMVSNNTSLYDAQTSNVRAFYLAEAGLNKAVWYLENTAPDGTMDGSWRTASYPSSPGPDANDPQLESLEGEAYTIWVETSGANVMITARGSSDGIERIVRQEILLVGGTPKMASAVNDTWQEI